MIPVMSKIKIAIADDHPVVTEGLRIVLKYDPRFLVEGTFVNGESLLIFLAENPVDVVILDIDIPGGEDFAILKKIKLMNRNCKVVIFTMHSGIRYFLEAKQFGADSYVVKTESVTFLPSVILFAMKGEFYCSDEVKGFMNSSNKNTSLEPIELEIVSCITKGMNYKQIGEKIGRSEKTVEYHAKKIRTNFGVGTNAELLNLVNQ